MEKYGVELDKEKIIKEAGGKSGEPTVRERVDALSKCPICEEKLDSGGACPIHGTEPLEKKERD